jgi:hypothetical protein
MNFGCQRDKIQLLDGCNFDFKCSSVSGGGPARRLERLSVGLTHRSLQMGK